MSPVIRCTACGEVRRHHGRQRCQRCYAWRRRHGTERPRDWPGRGTPRPCAVCGEAVRRRRLGRCARCYMWWVNHGRQDERPASIDLRGTRRPCVHCGRLAGGRERYTRQLCAPCYQRACRRGLPPLGEPVVVPPPAVAPGRPSRPCERCRRWLGGNAPDFQTLCKRCAATWLEEIAQ